MTADLVLRLKQMEEFFHLDYHLIKKISREAADRIEKLEAALQAVIRYAGNTGDDYLADQARKALEGKSE